MCDVLDVSRNTDHQPLDKTISNHNQENLKLIELYDDNDKQHSAPKICYFLNKEELSSKCQ